MVLITIYQHILIRISAIFFSDFYTNKLSYICSISSNTLLVLDTSYGLTSENYSSDNYFHSLCSVSNVDISNLIITLKSSSHLDPHPISLVHNLESFLIRLLIVLLDQEKYLIF